MPKARASILLLTMTLAGPLVGAAGADHVATHVEAGTAAGVGIDADGQDGAIDAGAEGSLGAGSGAILLAAAASGSADLHGPDAANTSTASDGHDAGLGARVGVPATAAVRAALVTQLRASERRPLGELLVHDDTIEGDFVSFRPDATSDGTFAGISEHTVDRGDVRLWDHVSFEGAVADDYDLDDGTFRMHADGATITVYDTAPAVVRARAADDVPIRLWMPDGAAADLWREREDDWKAYRVTYADGVQGTVHGRGLALDAEDRTFVVTGWAQARLRTQAMPEPEPESRLRTAVALGTSGQGATADPDAWLPLSAAARVVIEDAIVDGHAGVEASARHAGVGHVVIDDAGVTVTGFALDPDPRTRLRLELEAPDATPGTVVVLNLDPADVEGWLDAHDGTGIEIRFDGEAASVAADLDDALSADGDTRAEFLLLVGDDRVQLLLTVPHFSAHTVEIVTTTLAAGTKDGDQEPRGLPWPGTVPVLVLAAAAGAGLGRRRWH